MPIIALLVKLWRGRERSIEQRGPGLYRKALGLALSRWDRDILLRALGENPNDPDAMEAALKRIAHMLIHEHSRADLHAGSIESTDSPTPQPQLSA